MSVNPAPVSKHRGRLEKAVVNSPRAARARATATEPPPPTSAPTSPVVGSIVASAIALIPFRDLKRAPENVRHIRKDEDIEPLADDISAHGLLQSLIGYRAIDDAHRSRVERIWIVGGGRRLQALGILVDRGVIDIDFLVPVLIRDRVEAVELSLTENLQKRDMSPVDECHAFVTLMAPGTTSPLELAKRFGFSEIYVKQRLRLAELAEPILGALAEKKITLGSAMAYATSSDRELQLQIFEQHEKSGYDQHSPVRVKADYRAAQLTTDSPLFKFVGAEIYERDGGTYEDDLFAGDQTSTGGRKLANGPILNTAAQQMLESQATRLLAEIQTKHPTITDVVFPPNMRADGIPWKSPKAPAGHVLIEPDYSMLNTQDKIWERIDSLGVAAIAIIGINEQGQLAMRPRSVFVRADSARKVKVVPKSPGSSGYSGPSPEEVERDQIAKAIDLQQWRLGIGSFAGTPLEGRAFWPIRSYGIQAVEATLDPRLQDGRLVTVQVYVTNAEHDAMRDKARQRVEEDRAADAERARVAAQAKLEREQLIAELVKMDPPPAVIVIGGTSWFFDRATGWQDEPLDSVADRVARYRRTEDLLAARALSGEAIEIYGSVETYADKLAGEAA